VERNFDLYESVRGEGNVNKIALGAYELGLFCA
jgi:hypothetical protein